MWYSSPGSGKSLLALHLTLEAIRENRLAAGNVFYVNADDNSSGIAQKLRLLQDVGAHMLVPGYQGFRASDMQGLFMDMALANKAKGVVVVVDTLKKACDLMSKRESSEFADACRQFVMRGGTVLGLAHVNKHPSPNGNLRYAGTTDFVEDFDAVFIIAPLDREGQVSEKVVRFDCIKRRGDSPDKAAYAYSTENGLSYDQLLASVEAVNFDKLGEIERIIEQRTDAELVAAVQNCIGAGINSKMHIASEVAKRTKASGKSIIKLLDRYTGDNPGEHHWSFRIGERGRHVFFLLPDAAQPD